MLRRCTKCGAEHPATPEYFQRAQQGRLRGECKSCTAKAHAAIYQRDRAKRDAVNKQWVRDHPEARRAHSKKYQDAHREECRERHRAWFQKDPDRARAINRAKTNRWFRRHLDHAREVRRAAVKKRKAIKRGAGASKLTRQEWRDIQALYDHCCAYCGERKRLTQDHVIPLKNGGHHTKDNVVPACMTCNCSKKAGPPPVPIAALKFLSHSVQTISPSAVGPLPPYQYNAPTL